MGKNCQCKYSSYWTWLLWTDFLLSTSTWGQIQGPWPYNHSTIMLVTPTGPLIKQEAWVYNITTSLVNIKCCTSDRKLLCFPPSDNIIPDSFKVADTVAAVLIYLVIDLFQQIYMGLELANSQLFTSHPSLFPFSLGHVCLLLTALQQVWGTQQYSPRLAWQAPDGKHAYSQDPYQTMFPAPQKSLFLPFSCCLPWVTTVWTSKSMG